jgi:hypothetical protein
MAAKLIFQLVGEATSAVAAFKKTGDAAKTTTSAAKTTGSSLGKIAGAVATGYAVSKIVDFGKTTVKAAEESAVAHNRLVSTFKGVGDASGAAAAAAEAYAGKLSKQTGVDDEAIMGAQALLATFHSVSGASAQQAGIFDRATAAAADLAAAGYGDLNSNAIQLGKALEDPVKGMAALSKSGVTFTAAQKQAILSMEKTGNHLGAQKVVLQNVESQVKGTAAATATSSAKMSVAWGNAQEAIGTALLPAISKISDVLTKLFIFVDANSSWLMPLIGGAIALAGTALAVSKAVSIFKGALEGVKLAVSGVKLAWMLLNSTFLASPLGLIIVGIVAVVAALVILYLKVAWFRNFVNAAFRGIIAGAQWLWSGLVGIFNALVAFFQRWGNLILFVLLGPWYLVFKLIKAAITGGWSGIVAQLNQWLGILGGIFGRVVGIIVAPFRGAWNAVYNAFIGPLVRGFAAIPGQIGGAISGVFGAIIAPFQRAYSWIQSNILGPLRSAWNGFANIINGVSLSTPAVKVAGHTLIPAFHWTPPWHIPTLAAGGLMTRTGLVYAHAGEVISPAPAAARGRWDQLVRIDTANFGERVDVDTFGKRLAWQIRTAGV